jgi:hypothetical protein
MQIQNHDIAVPGGAKQIHSILIRLQDNIELLPESRGKQRVERPVFRIQSDLDHCWTRSLTKHAAKPPSGRSGAAEMIFLNPRLQHPSSIEPDYAALAAYRNHNMSFIGNCRL